jgi:hypothetical protein
MSVAITLADTGMSIFSLSTTSSREGDVEEQKDEGERVSIERVQCELKEALLGWYPSCDGSSDVVRSRGAAGTPPLSCAA